MHHPFDRKLWEEIEYPIERDDIHMFDWPCPNCWQTKLTIFKTLDDLKIENYPEREEAGLTGEEGCYLFSGHLNCKKCFYLFTFLGSVEWECQDYIDYEDKEYKSKWVSNYIPKFFYPNLRLFKFEKYYPYDIKTILDRSFSLYFSDIHASANMLRVAVEKVLDLREMGSIPRMKDGQFFSLDHRINMIEDNTIKTRLKAIKWIGNSGAHLDEQTLSNNDYLDAVEIFHLFLDDKFSTRKSKIDKKAISINEKHKRTLSPKLISSEKKGGGSLDI